MSLIRFIKRDPFFSAGMALLFIVWCVSPEKAWTIDGRLFSIVGAQLWSPPLTVSAKGPRINILETDGWRHSWADGKLQPVPQIPLPRTFWSTLWDGIRRSPPSTHLTPPATFTPTA